MRELCAVCKKLTDVHFRKTPINEEVSLKISFLDRGMFATLCNECFEQLAPSALTKLFIQPEEG